MGLRLEQAQKIVAAALTHARQKSMKPMAFVVLDERGALRAVASEDGTSLARWKVAYGKAHGALSLGSQLAQAPRVNRRPNLTRGTYSYHIEPLAKRLTKPA
jgi:uncharacterized protein GlcG (DUF336 family)